MQTATIPNRHTVHAGKIMVALWTGENVNVDGGTVVNVVRPFPTVPETFRAMPLGSSTRSIRVRSFDNTRSYSPARFAMQTHRTMRRAHRGLITLTIAV